MLFVDYTIALHAMDMYSKCSLPMRVRTMDTWRYGAHFVTRGLQFTAYQGHLRLMGVDGKM